MKAFSGIAIAMFLALTPLPAAHALESTQWEISLGLVPFSSDVLATLRAPTPR